MLLMATRISPFFSASPKSFFKGSEKRERKTQTSYYNIKHDKLREAEVNSTRFVLHCLLAGAMHMLNLFLCLQLYSMIQ